MAEWHAIDDPEHPAPTYEDVLAINARPYSGQYYVAQRWDDSWHEMREFMTIDPTHWMPLPPPPKDEGK